MLQEHPRKARPTDDSVIELCIIQDCINYSGKWKSSEGPIIKRAPEAKMKATKVNHRRGTNVDRHPTKGEDRAYVAQMRPKKYPRR
jgi:hypothetical protein